MTNQPVETPVQAESQKLKTASYVISIVSLVFMFFLKENFTPVEDHRESLITLCLIGSGVTIVGAVLGKKSGDRKAMLFNIICTALFVIILATTNLLEIMFSIFLLFPVIIVGGVLFLIILGAVKWSDNVPVKGMEPDELLSEKDNDF